MNSKGLNHGKGDMTAIVCDRASALNGAVLRRRSHAARRAESSTLIIEATIRCLNETGYGSTSIDAVIAEAGVSKGRLLNLFPTKVDLMLAVGRHVWQLDQLYASSQRQQSANPRDMLLSLVDILWHMMSAASGVAVLEILVACRSDKTLAAQFVPEHREVQQKAIEALHDLIADVGLADQIDARTLHSYFEANIRGQVIDRVFTDNPKSPPAALQFVRDELARMCALGSGENHLIAPRHRSGNKTV